MHVDMQPCIGALHDWSALQSSLQHSRYAAVVLVVHSSRSEAHARMTRRTRRTKEACRDSPALLQKTDLDVLSRQVPKQGGIAFKTEPAPWLSATKPQEACALALRYAAAWRAWSTVLKGYNRCANARDIEWRKHPYHQNTSLASHFFAVTGLLGLYNYCVPRKSSTCIASVSMVQIAQAQMKGRGVEG